jgi:hypothetical protein
MMFRFIFTNLPARVKLIESFVPPELDELNKGLKPFGLKAPGISLIFELAQLAAGGEVKGEVELEAEIRFTISKKPPLWLLLTGPFRKKAIDRLVRRQIDSLQIMQLLDEITLPGYNAFERLISAVVLYFITNVAVSKYGAKIEDLRAIFKELTQIAQTMDDFERELLGALPSDQEMSTLPPFLQAQFDQAKIDADLYFAGDEARAIYSLGKGVQEIKAQKAFSENQQRTGMAPLELVDCLKLISHPGRFLIISTSRKLENFSAFNYVRSHKFTPCDSGNDFSYRRMDAFSDIARLRPLDYAFSVVASDYFFHRLVTHDYLIKEPGYMEEVRQVAYILIDRSPSNLVKGRLFKSLGVVFNRLLGIVRTDAVVVVQFFDDELEQPITILDINEAVRFMKCASMQRFVGSGTNQDKAIRFATSKLTQLPKSERDLKPHLILVGDGDGEVTVQRADLENICFHAFITADANPVLKDLCLSTNGLYYQDL